MVHGIKLHIFYTNSSKEQARTTLKQICNPIHDERAVSSQVTLTLPKSPWK